MKTLKSIILAIKIITALMLPLGLMAQGDDAVALFDGKSLANWEGDTAETWRIENNELVGGSVDRMQPDNNFLTTKKTYKNFDLNLKFQLLGSEGFINSGIQFHSVRAQDPNYEMIGYQADLGDGFWAGLYDETRRNKTLIAPDSAQVLGWLKRNEWNDYRVRADNGHIQIWLNGHKAIDYHEPDEAIPQEGLIGLQIHGGGKAEVRFKDIMIKEVP